MNKDETKRPKTYFARVYFTLEKEYTQLGILQILTFGTNFPSQNKMQLEGLK